MNRYNASKEVVKLLESEDNIIEQIKALRKYKYRNGVKPYIDALRKANQMKNDEVSHYIMYCIVKYFYELDVKDVKKPKDIKLTSTIEYLDEVDNE